jgi:hypothetical protein
VIRAFALTGAVGLTALAAACNPLAQAGVCGAVPAGEIETALGGKPQAQAAAAETTDEKNQTICSWTAETPEGGQRMLALMVERGAGRAHYESESTKLKAAYTRVGALADVGEAALMGVGEDADVDRFSAEIVAIKGANVLSLRIEGKDPAAFEAVARSAAKAM